MSDPNHLENKPSTKAQDEKRPTLKTIAFMTGLGVTTVSRALKDAPDISQATKDRVRLVARQIGYRPNRAGLRLRTGKTNVISLIIDTEEEVMGLTPQMIVGITEALADTSYHLVVTPYSHSKDPMEPVRYVTETKSADGIILSRIEPNDPRIRYLTENRMPFATHGRSNASTPHAFHDFDNTAFARDAVGVLFDQNRKKLSIVPPPQALTYAHHMLDGYFDGLMKYGLPHHPPGLVTVDDPIEMIADTFAKLLERGTSLDGVVCGSVSAAVGVAAGAERAGLVVGKDIDIIAKQPTVNFLRWFGRPIHAIDEDFREAGRDLARAVMAMIDGEDPADYQRICYSGKYRSL